MNLGDNIRFLRIKKGLSQDYIANKLGYKSYTTIQKWESGVSEPPVKKLRELSMLLGVDMDDMTNKNLQVANTDMLNKHNNLKKPEALSLDDFVNSDDITEFDMELLKAYFELDAETRKSMSIFLKSGFSAIVKDVALPEDVYSDIPDTPEELEKLYPPIELPHDDKID